MKTRPSRLVRIFSFILFLGLSLLKTLSFAQGPVIPALSFTTPTCSSPNSVITFGSNYSSANTYEIRSTSGNLIVQTKGNSVSVPGGQSYTIMVYKTGYLPVSGTIKTPVAQPYIPTISFTSPTSSNLSSTITFGENYDNGNTYEVRNASSGTLVVQTKSTTADVPAGQVYTLGVFRTGCMPGTITIPSALALKSGIAITNERVGNDIELQQGDKLAIKMVSISKNYFRITGMVDGSILTLSDGLGNILKKWKTSNHEEDINVSSYANGVYSVVVMEGSHFLNTFRFIKTN